MAGGDHNAAVEIFGAHHIGNTGGGSDMKQVDICSGCCQTCYQGILKHVAAAAGIFSNDDPGFVVFSVIPSQKTSYFIGVLYVQNNVGLAAESIGTKIFSQTFTSILFDSFSNLLFSFFTVYGGAVGVCVCALLLAAWNRVSGFIILRSGKNDKRGKKRGGGCVPAKITAPNKISACQSDCSFPEFNPRG